MYAPSGDTDILSERVTQLGNYFGALANWVELQNATETKHQGRNQDTVLLYAAVGLHALTMPQDPKKLLQDRMDTLASLLAIGLSPDKSIIFCQEDVRDWFPIARYCNNHHNRYLTTLSSRGCLAAKL
jgi:tryptophanyl-tRNA synthetase